MTEPMFLTLDEVLRIHAYQASNFGGSDALLDLEKLESAIAQPRQSYAGNYLHEDLPAMAAAYLFHIVQNHPFEDGNKRTGAHAAIIFLSLNDIEFSITDDDLYDLTIGVANGSITKAELTDAFRRLLAMP